MPFSISFFCLLTTISPFSLMVSFVWPLAFSSVICDSSLTPGSTSESAIGTQGEKTVAEYQSRTGEIHVAVFNRKNGKFNAGRYEDITASPKVYSLKDGGNIGTALFFVLIPEAMKDDEFRENYDLLGRCKNDGYADMDEAEKAAFKSLEKLFATGQRDRDIYGTVTEDGILHLGELIYRKGECAESYLARRGLLDDRRYPVCFYGYLDESGCRTEDASIPRSPRDRAESQKKWQDTLQDYIGSLSDDDVLVGIDCHR